MPKVQLNEFHKKQRRQKIQCFFGRHDYQYYQVVMDTDYGDCSKIMICFKVCTCAKSKVEFIFPC